MKIALIQYNPVIGDLENNAQNILHKISQVQAHAPDLIVFPELSLIGYPPKDLLFNSNLLIESWNLLNSTVIPKVEIPTLIGLVSQAPTGKLYNSLALIEQKGLKRLFYKKLLPNYEVFNESRYFDAGLLEKPEDIICEVNGQKIAVFICEDLLAETFYSENQPIEFLQKHNLRPDLIVCAAASPYRLGQADKRIKLARQIQKKIINSPPIVLINQVGAQDDLIFDGFSFALNSSGGLSALAKGFEEETLICDTQNNYQFEKSNPIMTQIKDALVLGIKDYFRKTGFTKAFIGLSGGIDSALVATLATYALGETNVFGILMPSKYSSIGSIQDSETLVKNLKIKSEQISIQKILNSFLQESQLETLSLAEENLQARIRGSLLMALANNNKALVLATGNKSEFAVGYSTLYGDMCGALAPIGDLWKTQVWDLAKICPEIPQSIINKPPSAELKPNQLDTDSLPDYVILDRILKGFIEDKLSVQQLKDKGLPIAEIEKALKLFSQSEFKRRQAPIILKISPNAFGSGWLMPVAAKWF